MTLEKLLTDQRSFMLAYLESLLAEIKPMLLSDGPVTEEPDSEASCDVRLCLDLKAYCWTVYWSDPSYDQRHWPICGASSITLESTAESVYEDLVTDIEATDWSDA